MSYRKFESNLYCVGGRHQSATLSIECDVTKKGRKLFSGNCFKYNRKLSVVVNDNTIANQGLG